MQASRGERWRRGRVMVRAAVLVLLAASAALAQKDPPRPAGEVARLEAQNAALERRIELAGSKEFYLILDPVVPDLTLMLRGAALHRYPVLALSVGRPRVAFVRRGARATWRGVIFSGGRLDPPRELDRLEITPPPADAAGVEARPVIPPAPEEAYPVPLRYHVRFERGPSIEIRPREADPSSRWARVTTWWGARWRDTLAALRPPEGETVRLRLVLAPDDANALYRALPPGVKLLVTQ